jgi:hypothetical protein
VSPLAAYLKHRLEDKLVYIGDYLSKGLAESVDEYNAICGGAKAYRDVIELIETVSNADEDDLESFERVN